MDKSPEAFRTISEVAETLETPAHVLRFWESRFPQIRPVKRAGGRRYYRPADVALLTGIKRLLHDEGMTIRGVQKILREQGVRHVAGLAGAPEADLAPFDPEIALEQAMAERFGADRPTEPAQPAEVETAQIFALETALRRPVALPPMPDLFDLLAESEFVGEPVGPAHPAIAAEPLHSLPEHDVAAVEAAPEPQDAPEPTPATAAATPEPATQPDDRVRTTARAALLRTLPRPLTDAQRAALIPLRDRIAAHRDRLTAAGSIGGHRA